MPYSTEAQYAQAHPLEFQLGIAIGRGILSSNLDLSRDALGIEIDYELALWANAISPDFMSPQIRSQEMAVELGAKCEIELRKGFKL